MNISIFVYVGIAVVLMSYALAYVILDRRYSTAESKIDVTLSVRLKDPAFKDRVDAAKAAHKEIQALALELTAELNKPELDMYQPTHPEQMAKLIQKLLNS